MIALVFAVSVAVAARAAASPVLPTASQLEWSRNEIGAMVTWNLATSAGTQGCNTPAVGLPSPNVFKPTQFDPEQWADAIEAMNATNVVQVVKHGCGFTLWPTKATLPDGSPYEYSHSVDLVEQFANACRKRGIKFGLYYSVVTNAYLGVYGEKCKRIESYAARVL